MSDSAVTPVMPYAPQPRARVKFFLPTSLKDYMGFYRVSARPWWWALVTLVAFAVAYFLVLMVISVIMMILEPSIIADALEGKALVVTPGLFLGNNLMLAAGIPLALVASWVFYKQGFGWFSSVTGRFRWKWLGLTLGVFAAGYVVVYLVEYLIMGGESLGYTEMEMKPYTWFMIPVILLTTPLQCAAEEIVTRGLLPRLICALIPPRLVGLIVAASVSTAVFILFHMAQDVWLNTYYGVLGFTLWWLVYRTGGLEASIALHIVNNLFAMAILPFVDFSDMFNRESGTGSPIVIWYLLTQIAMVLLIDFLARRKGLVRMSSPASEVPQVLKPKKFITPPSEAVEATQEDLRLVTVNLWPTLSPEVPSVPMGGTRGLLSADQAKPWAERIQPPETPQVPQETNPVPQETNPPS